MACWWGRKMVEATVSTGKVGAGTGPSGAGEKQEGVERGAPESPEAIPGEGNNEIV